MTWAARLDELMWACGWTQITAAKHFGCSWTVIARVLKGGTPKVSFIVKLKNLEAAYAGEIEALRSGAIHKASSRRRIDDFRRPENCTPLGGDAAVGEARRFGSGSSLPDSSRVVHLSDEVRNKLAPGYQSRAGRSATIYRGTGDAA